MSERDSKRNAKDPNLESISLWLDVIRPEEPFSITPIDQRPTAAPRYQISDSHGTSVQLDWSPETLKEVLDHALRLSHLLGDMSGMMAFLAEKEEELRSLRKLLEVPVKDIAFGAPRAGIIILADQPTIMGRWAPDLIDRAGGRAVFHEPGDPDTKLNVRDRITSAPDVLFFQSTSPVVSEYEAESAILSRSKRLMHDVDFTGSAYLFVKHSPALSSPDLYKSIMILAAGLYPENPGLEDARYGLHRIR